MSTFGSTDPSSSIFSRMILLYIKSPGLLSLSGIQVRLDYTGLHPGKPSGGKLVNFEKHWRVWYFLFSSHLSGSLANARVSSKPKVFNVGNKGINSFLGSRGVRPKLLESVQNRTVASAPGWKMICGKSCTGYLLILHGIPAKVSVQDVVDLLHGGVGVLLKEGVQLHHHARAGGGKVARQAIEYSKMYCIEYEPAESTLSSSVGSQFKLDWVVVWLEGRMALISGIGFAGNIWETDLCPKPFHSGDIPSRTEGHRSKALERRTLWIFVRKTTMVSWDKGVMKIMK